jgi:RNA polymerase sigma-32 factor
MNKEIPFTAKTIGHIIANIKKRHILPQVWKLRIIRRQATEVRLIKMWQSGNQRAGLLLVGAHLKLVLYRIKKFNVHHGSWMFEPLFKAGIEGLCKAGREFDLSREVRFNTYARWRVLEAVIDEFLSLVTLVSGITTSRIRTAYSPLTKWKHTHNIIQDQPVPDDLIEAAREYCDNRVDILVTKETVLNTDLLLCGGLDCNSLDQSVTAEGGGGETTFMDLLLSTAPGPDILVEQAMDGQKLHDLLQAVMGKVLNEREQLIIKERRLRDPAVTLEELGIQLGVTKERIRQIEFRALEKLKQAIHTQNEVTNDNPSIDLDRITAAVRKIKNQDQQQVLIRYHLMPPQKRPSLRTLADALRISQTAMCRLNNNALASLRRIIPTFNSKACDEALTARELSA